MVEYSSEVQTQGHLISDTPKYIQCIRIQIHWVAIFHTSSPRPYHCIWIRINICFVLEPYWLTSAHFYPLVFLDLPGRSESLGTNLRVAPALLCWQCCQ